MVFQVALFSIAFLPISLGQYGVDPASERHFVDEELSHIPDDIVDCYVKQELWDRYRRPPSSIDSLTALIRKVELHPSVRNWTPGRLAATLVHKFRFDGIHYDRCIDTSTGAVPLKLDLQAEYPKMQLIWQLVDGEREEFPDDALSPKEKCALHWILSYSVNTTFREEEYFLNVDPPYGPYVQPPHGYQGDQGYQNDDPGFWDDTGYQSDEGYRSGHGYKAGQEYIYGQVARPGKINKGVIRKNFAYPREPGPGYDCDSRQAFSLAPLEMGVVWSRAGPVTAGTVVTGLAAGLRPQTAFWPSSPNGGNGNRRMDSGWGVTLAGDVAQTALLKRKGQTYVGPDGYFNTTLCPTEFMLRHMQAGGTHYGEPTFSHLTIAEINGGIDGLILAMHADDWEKRSELSLSQMIDMYYSRYGLRVMARSTVLTACQRYENYKKMIDKYKLAEEATTFALELKHVMVSPVAETAIQASVNFAIQAVDREVDLLEKSLFKSFFECTDDFTLAPPSVQDDSDLYYSGIADVTLILDTSIYAADDDLYQQQLAAGLALQLDMWTTGTMGKSQHDTVYVEGGSTFEVVEGRHGDPIFNYGNEPGNKAVMACDIIKQILAPTGGDVDPGVALTNSLARMAARQADWLEKGVSQGRSQVVVLVLFGRVASNDRQALSNAVWRMRDRMPEAKLMIATRWAPIRDFFDYVTDPNKDIISLQQYDEERRAILDARRLADRIARLPGQISYSLCQGEDYKEWESEQIIYLLPNTQRVLMLHPRYYFLSEDLILTFTVRYNSANICWSHKNYDSYDDKEKPNEECKAVSVTKGSSSSSKVTFTFNDPCDGRPPEICMPLYFRLEGVDSGGLGCSTEDDFPCKVANAAEVTITHQGMTCGAQINPVSSFLLVISGFALLLSRL